MMRWLGFMERWAAFGQGKGYGSKSIEREIRAAASLMDAPPQTIIDGGGNVGAYTKSLTRLFPRARIHVFEPSSSNCKILREDYRDSRQVVVNQVALGAQNGEALLYSDVKGSVLASMTRRRVNHFGIQFDEEEPIKVMRFEDYWKTRLNGEHIDFAKLDIEGHELEALGGFGEAISACSLIQFEFGGCNIDTRTFFQDFWYFFSAAAFDLYRITPFNVQRIERYSEMDECFVTTNFLAKRR